MAILGGEIIKITDRQTLFGQEVLNVYWYQIATDLGGATAAEIAEQWWGSLGEEIRAVQHTSLNHIDVTVESIDGSRDFGTFTIPGGGENGAIGTGDCMPPFTTWSFTLIPENRLVRPGGKRIAGVPELEVASGGVVGSSITPTLIELAEEMARQLNYLSTLDALIPVVVGFPHPASPTGRPARLDRVEIRVASVQVSPYVSTQNTRKYGRGT